MRDVEHRTIILSVKGGTCKSPAAVRIGISEWGPSMVGRTSLRSLPSHRALGKAENLLLLVLPLGSRALTIGLDATIIVGISTIISTPSPLGPGSGSGSGSAAVVVTAPSDLSISLSVLEPVHGGFSNDRNSYSLLVVGPTRSDVADFPLPGCPGPTILGG